MMRRTLKIITPENVHVEYEIAGFGSRFSAFFIDYLIQNTIAVSLSVVYTSYMFLEDVFSSYVQAIIIILYFLLSFGYFVFFEYKTNGQTPGKKLLKLRVIKKTGEPVGIKECLLRNIIRILDMLIIGAIFIIFTKNYSRIGDIVSNTIVIKEQKQKAFLISNESEEEDFIINEYPVDNNEYSVLKDFVERYNNMNNHKYHLEERLNKYFVKKFNIDKFKYDRPLTFFKEILKMNEQ